MGDQTLHVNTFFLLPLCNRPPSFVAPSQLTVLLAWVDIHLKDVIILIISAPAVPPNCLPFYTSPPDCLGEFSRAIRPPPFSPSSLPIHTSGMM